MSYLPDAIPRLGIPRLLPEGAPLSHPSLFVHRFQTAVTFIGIMIPLGSVFGSNRDTEVTLLHLLHGSLSRPELHEVPAVLFKSFP
jgi:hypothetical protein